MAYLLGVSAVVSVGAPDVGAVTDTVSTTGVHVVAVPVPDALFGGPGGGIANAVADDGTIVGTAEQPSLRAFTWDGIGHPTLIAAPNAGDPTFGTDINLSGQVVGAYGSPKRAFSWDGATFTDLGAPPGFSVGGSLEAAGVDDVGNIVGTFSATSTAACQPANIIVGRCSFARTAGSTSLTVIPPPDADTAFLVTDVDGGTAVGNGWSYALGGAFSPLPGQALALDGSVVVGTVQTVDGTRAAILSDPPVVLPTLGGASSVAHGYGHGWVVGSSQTAGGETHAFYWSSSDGMVDLGTLGGSDSEALGVNASGLIVGRAQDGGLWRPVVWDPLGIFDPDFPPEIAPIPGQQIGEGDPLTITPDVSDPDADPFTVTWTNLPAGASQVGTSFVWDSAVAGSYVVTVTAVQDGQPRNSTSVDVTIDVIAGNHAPALDPIGLQSAQPGAPLVFTATAHDPDQPTQTLTYRMVFGTPSAPIPPPGNASIDPLTGVFSWTPTTADIGPHTVTIGVFDDGTPQLADTETFTIAVYPPVALAVDESVGVADRPSVVTSVMISLSEGVGVSDAPSIAPSVRISVSEGVGVLDDVAVRPPILISIGEGVAVADSVTASPSILIGVVERVGVTDEVSVIPIPSLTISIREGVGVRDAASVLPPVIISVGEGVGVGDSMLVTPPISITVTEVVGVADGASIRPPVVISIAEGVGSSDMVSTVVPVEITVAEGVGLSDTVRASTVSTGAATFVDVIPGQGVTFSGDGFAPGLGIEIGLRSTFLPLMTVVADSAGAFVAHLTIPTDLPPSFAGSHTLVAVGVDPDGYPHEARAEMFVHAPVAVALSDSNPTALTVDDASSFTLEARFVDVSGDLTAADLDPGEATLTLEPVGSGSRYDGACEPVDPAVVRCVFEGVEVDTYTVVAAIGGPGSVFLGSDESVLTVYDPTLGFTTGGGWFGWPRDGGRTNFGYTMKYNKKGTNLKGSFLLIRRLPDGGRYRIKSNALDALAIGAEYDPPWATFTGKATYLAPWMSEPDGNYTFLVYVVDSPLGDRFWIQVRDKDGAVVDAISMVSPASSESVLVAGGDIVIPHTARRGPARQ